MFHYVIFEDGLCILTDVSSSGYRISYDLCGMTNLLHRCKDR